MLMKKYELAMEHIRNDNQNLSKCAVNEPREFRVGVTLVV